MEPLSTVNRWMERVRDRERVHAFARFLARRFLDDRLFQAAAALAAEMPEREPEAEKEPETAAADTEPEAEKEPEAGEA